MRHVLAISPCVFILALIVGCGERAERRSSAASRRSEAAKESRSAQLDPATSAEASSDLAADPHQPERKLSDPIRGKVVETLDGGGYTYVKLTTEEGDFWAAARKFSVAAGDEVEIAGMTPMRNFHSPTLKRTFKEIQFAGRARLIGDSAVGDSAQPHDGPSMAGMPPGHPSLDGVAAPPKPGPATPPKPGEIEPLSDGLTIAKLYDGRADWDGKTVRFRGRVVKASSGILGKNWLHIQDGTGAPGSNDITVTSTTAFAQPGSIVIVEGTVALNKDFGAGYSYEVIVENATLTMESP